MSAAAELIFSRTPLRPRIGIVLGSGLGAFADKLMSAVRFPYTDLPGFPRSTAVGHAGVLVLGQMGGNGRGALDIAVMSGRFHLYEGYSAQQAAAGIRLFETLGITRVILTNAAGGINPDFTPGTLVLIADHINLQGTNPLVGWRGTPPGSQFTDLVDAYSPRLRRIARQVAGELGLPLPEGIYAGLLGPSYETPAEIRFLRLIGADLVGMSTVAETIAARQAGIEVLGLSCVTNAAAGLTETKLSHQDVLETGRLAAAVFSKLLTTVVPRIAVLDD